MQPVNAVLPGAGFVEEKLLAPQQALVAYFARVAIARPSIEYVSLGDAFGRVLARDAQAEQNFPSTARSAMDGYAVVAADTPGGFHVVGEVLMGAPGGAAVTSGIALRVPTGGVVPAGADAVVPVEDTRDEGGGRIAVAEHVAPGENVIDEGSDMTRGWTAIRAGRRLGAPHLGVLATLGVTVVPVYARPVVGVLSTGDELVEPSEIPGPGQVRDSNRYAIAGALLAMGAQPRHYPKVGDEPGELETMLAKALDECDAVAVTGGSSVGERDRLPQAVAALGDPGIVVHGLRIKPGKPALLGARGTKPILGLPGNPSSALIVLEAVASPILAALGGTVPQRRAFSARLAEPVRSRPGWTWYIPVAVGDDAGGPVAHPLAIRSFSVSLTARADGYITMGEADDCWPAGTTVAVHRFAGG